MPLPSAWRCRQLELIRIGQARLHGLPHSEATFQVAFLLGA